MKADRSDRHEARYSMLYGGPRSDRDVILAVRALVTDALGWTADDVLPADDALPSGVGAAVAAGMSEPWICVRADLPAALRADLWGFGFALAVAVQDDAVRSGRGGLLYVGLDRRPATGRGVAQTGALLLRRLGRPGANTSFPVHLVYAWRSGVSDHEVSRAA